MNSILIVRAGFVLEYLKNCISVQVRKLMGIAKNLAASYSGKERVFIIVGILWCNLI
jgi:hypothetical protein